MDDLDSRAGGAHRRVGRRRLVVAVSAVVVVVAAALATVILLNRDTRPSSPPNVIPADQPTCPSTLPDGPRPGGLITGTGPTPTLATACDYDPTTKRLRGLIGQFTPDQIPDFVTFLRDLTPASDTDCGSGLPIAATSVQFLTDDMTHRSLSVVSTATCATLSDGSTSIVVPVASLADWLFIDPALPTPPPQVTSDDVVPYTTPTPAASTPAGTATSTT